MTMSINLKLCPKTLSGGLNPLNRGSCDWGWQGMLAYGCQNVVVIVDTKTLQMVQSLDRHKHPVVKVKWSRENYHHDLMSGYTLRLASGDANGRIIVWDANSAAIKSEFQDGQKAIADLEWLSQQDASHDLLAALHPNSTLILWNADTGTKLWKKTYADTLLSFTFDPFDSSRVAFLGQECVLFIDDFSATRAPSSAGKRYYIASPGGGGSGSNSTDKNRASKNTLTKRMTRMLVGEPSKARTASEEATSAVYLNDCLQLAFHRSRRHHVLLVYAREILLLDLEINQTVAIVSVMDRSGSSFVQVIPCRQRDALLCLHESGAIGLRVCRRNATSPNDPSNRDVATELLYDLRCQSDALRVTKHLKVLGMTCCPVSENRVALVMSDGKTLLWELKATEVEMETATSGLASTSPLYTPGCHSYLRFSFPSLPNNAAMPRTSLAAMFGQFPHETPSCVGGSRHAVTLKFLLTGLANGVSGIPNAIRMCPPLTTKNYKVYRPLLAIGCSTGMVQVADLSYGQIWREYSIHTSQVRGIEWISLTSFLSFAYPPLGVSGLVKNELIVTDTKTGDIRHLRQNKDDDESPIEFIRISHLKLYFVIAFKEKPFELWDLKNCTILREMPRSFPRITSLEWSPSHYLKSLRRKDTADDGISSAGSSDVTSLANLAAPESLRLKPNVKTELSGAREHFVFTDSDGLLYHFIVEGNVIKEGTKVPPDGGMGSITYIAWKGDIMIMGDTEGNLSIWDLRSRVSKAVPLHRGCIQKIKFAPGKANQKIAVLFNDGAEIWDSKEIKMISSLRCPKEMPKILDLDWACSGEAVFSFADGSIRVMDVRLKQTCSALGEQELAEPFFSPHCQLPKVAFTIKYHLQHQPWKYESGYQYSVEGLSANMQDIQEASNQQLTLLDGSLKAYLSGCGTARRCLEVAQLYGDESELHFWTVALYYLQQTDSSSKADKQLHRSISESNSVGTAAHSALTADVTQKPPAPSSGRRVEPLESCYDIVCSSEDFKKTQLDRLCLHETKRATYEHTRKCAETMMLLGQTDRAVQLLLETESDNENYYVDSLRACLVASIRSSNVSQSTIKLVATNLIASGQLSEGVQLLCLIDKGVDACRYLQTYGAWDQAAWLAKSTLGSDESAEVLRRWVDHLCSSHVNQKSKAILVLLSLGEFHKVVELLYGMRHFDRATLFIEACLECGALSTEAKSKPLIEAVFLEYARSMTTMGNKMAASHYCRLAGENGAQLQRETDFII